MTLGCEDIGVRKSDFDAKTQFLYVWNLTWKCLNFEKNTNESVFDQTIVQ